MKVIPTDGKILRIDASEWFALDAFRAAVERDTSPAADASMATFHRHGSPFAGDSDIFILFDAYEAFEANDTMRWVVEASNLLDEPGLEQVYDSVANVTRELGLRHGILWLSNVSVPRL